MNWEIPLPYPEEPNKEIHVTSLNVLWFINKPPFIYTAMSFLKISCYFGTNLKIKPDRFIETDGAIIWESHHIQALQI